MRAKEFVSEEQHLSEVMPLVARTAAKAGAAAAGAAKTAAKAIGGNKTSQGTVGTQGTQGTKQTMGQDPELDRAVDQMLKPGKQVDLPTEKGQNQKFKVSRVTPDEVEIENPNGKKSSSQPNKLVYKKDDIKNTLKR